MSTPIRLAKRLAELLPCSRREAELYITGGWVTVDGQVVEAPQFMVDTQQVALLPDAKLTPVEPVTILFNQPLNTDLDDKELQQLLNADTRSADDHSGIRFLKQHLHKLVQHLPLEPHAGGLVVLTQDRRMARKLEDDAAVLEQEYVVEVAGEMVTDGLKLLNHGLAFEGRALPPAKVSWQNETRLRFALKGGRSGQIAHMCGSVGLQVRSVKRLRIGRVPMGKLPPGCWRYLLPHERF